MRKRKCFEREINTLFFFFFRDCGFTLRPRVYRMFAADQGFHEMLLTERGEILTQCSQQNDLRIPTTNYGFTLRPRVYRMFPADQETERVDIGMQTSRNSPTQGNDNR
ncbi:uncharacterized protein LOC113684727 [Pocillopora damicornis]|uniref:uncharacterized protein LOC113684727 n=1 Tax=Pocillopora damicornis TaxID=46731 RepID=UPI000F558388|nr:uncharacterized protein LOC113684727 [Pocillopora damicornis]